MKKPTRTQKAAFEGDDCDHWTSQQPPKSNTGNAVPMDKPWIRPNAKPRKLTRKILEEASAKLREQPKFTGYGTGYPAPVPDDMWRAGVDELVGVIFGHKHRPVSSDRESRASDLPPRAWLAIGRVRTFGQQKHPRDHWPSLPADDHLNAVARHMAKYRMGQKADPESGEHPLAHAALRLLMALDVLLKAEEKTAEKVAPYDVG